jgi:hypothetical protein
VENPTVDVLDRLAATLSVPIAEFSNCREKMLRHLNLYEADGVRRDSLGYSIFLHYGASPWTQPQQPMPQFSDIVANNPRPQRKRVARLKYSTSLRNGCDANAEKEQASKAHLPR